jgi:serine/threonine protein kinase
MKTCPQCGERFEPTLKFCPRDGQVLEVSPQEMVGKVLDGQYEIEAFVASGGMGTVYRARHILLGDRVAIKVLRPELRANPEWLRRFQREGQAARRFTHPNAVAVYDLRTSADGLVYMVMEFVEGRALDEELARRGRFTPAESLEVLEPVARVLEEAHKQGVVHRDLKPANVMLKHETDGSVWVELLDLGIAKLREFAEEGGVTDTPLTLAGQILGTPYYMSPEQWGERQRDGNPEIDGRADIYSLALLFYELITGARPFEAKTLAELRLAHVGVTPRRLDEVVSGVPEKFARGVAHGMAKDRGDRPPTAAAFVEELRAALDLPAGQPATSRAAHSDEQLAPRNGEPTATLMHADAAQTMTTDVSSVVSKDEAGVVAPTTTIWSGGEQDGSSSTATSPLATAARARRETPEQRTSQEPPSAHAKFPPAHASLSSAPASVAPANVSPTSVASTNVAPANVAPANAALAQSDAAHSDAAPSGVAPSEVTRASVATQATTPLTTSPVATSPGDATGSSGAQGAASVRAGLRARAPLIILGLAILLIVSGVIVGAAWFLWSRWEQSRVVLTGAPPPAPAPEATTENAPAPARVEALTYWIEAFDDAGQKEGARVAQAGAISLASGQQFKFHFSPVARGYFYVVGPGAGNAPTTFLTAQPVGVLKTNQAAADSDFAFPYGEGQVLQLDKNPGTEEYTIIFSQTPLLAPQFLVARAGHELTPAELKELEDLRASAKTAAPALDVKESGEGLRVVSVVVPDEDAASLVVFDIRIEHQ